MGETCRGRGRARRRVFATSWFPTLTGRKLGAHWKQAGERNAALRASGARRCVSPASGSDRRRVRSRIVKRTYRNARPSAHRPSARCRHDRVKRRMPLCPVHQSPLLSSRRRLRCLFTYSCYIPLELCLVTRTNTTTLATCPLDRASRSIVAHTVPARHPSDARPKRAGTHLVDEVCAKRGSCAARNCERGRKNSTGLTSLQGLIASRCLTALRRSHDDEMKQMTACRA